MGIDLGFRGFPLKLMMIMMNSQYVLGTGLSSLHAIIHLISGKILRHTVSILISHMSKHV